MPISKNTPRKAIVELLIARRFGYLAEEAAQYYASEAETLCPKEENHAA